MGIPKFSDIDKAAKDLLSEDYPLEPKLGLKSTAKNGLNLKVDLNKAGDNVNGTLKCKVAHSSGLVLEEKWTTSNEVTTELSADNKLAQGTKVSLKSIFSPKTGPKSVAGTLEYNLPNLSSEATVDHSFGKNPTSVNVSSLFAYGNFRFGGAARVPVQNFQSVDHHTIGVQYIQSDLAVTSTVTNFAKVEGSIFHDVRPNLSAALKFSWDRSSTNDATQLEVGGKYYLDADSFVKAKVNTNQQVTLSYTQPLQRGVSLTLGAQLFPPKGDVATLSGKVGFSLNLS